MQASSGRAAIRWGIIFGVIIGIIGIVQNVLLHATLGPVLSSGSQQQIANASGGLLAISCVPCLLYLALLFVSGIFPARDTGRVGQGAIGGLIAGVVGTIIFGIAGIIINAINPVTVSSTTGSSSAVSTAGLGAGVGIIGFIIDLIILGGLGAGLGALGGLVGKAQYRGPVAAYQPSMYQGMGQPQGYPPAPGYPQQPQGQGYPPPPQYPQQPQQPQYPQYPQQPQENPPQNPGSYPPPPQYPPQQ